MDEMPKLLDFGVIVFIWVNSNHMGEMLFMIYAIGLIVGKIPKVLGLRKVMNV